MTSGDGRDRTPLFVGVDIGTQGARAVAVTADGTVAARSAHALVVPEPGPVQEQSPSDWWDAFAAVVRDLGDERESVVALAVSCTSGSVCAIDDDGIARGPGLLYADRRAVPLAGTDASWAVAKIAWLVGDGVGMIGDAARFTSPGGYVAGRLLGHRAAIDVTQALKFGHDPAQGRWGPLPVDAARLPDVVPTGTPLGIVAPAIAEALGLRSGVSVVAGATDGVAGQIACAPSPGRWAVAIGSTIVWKAVSPVRLDAPDEGIYSHRGPGSWWFPGAASNAGARVLSSWASPAELDAYGASVVVTPSVDAAWPAVGRGERFPFVDPGFEPWPASAATGPDRYAAEVLGIAFVERWGCETLVGHGCGAPQSIATTGGVVASTSFTQLRADVLQVPIEVPAEATSAFGAAIIAAASEHGGVLESASAMVRIADRFEPDRQTAGRWTDAFGLFREHCARRREGVA